MYSSMALLIPASSVTPAPAPTSMRASRIMKLVAAVSSSTSRQRAPTSSASWMLAACSPGGVG